MLQEQELLSSSFPGTARLFEYLLKLQTPSFWGVQAWTEEEKGGHNPLVLMPGCCWVATQLSRLCACICLGCSNPGLEELGWKLCAGRLGTQAEGRSLGRAGQHHGTLAEAQQGRSSC